MKKIKTKINKNQVIFYLSVKIYPLEAIYGAAYVFLDRAYLFLDSCSEKKIAVFLKGKNKLSRKQLEALKGDFLNELLNYAFRIKLSRDSRKLREFIVGQALVSAYGDDEVVQENEIGYKDDPLGIAVSWEDKYGAKLKKTEKEKK